VCEDGFIILYKCHVVFWNCRWIHRRHVIGQYRIPPLVSARHTQLIGVTRWHNPICCQHTEMWGICSHGQISNSKSHMVDWEKTSSLDGWHQSHAITCCSHNSSMVSHTICKIPSYQTGAILWEYGNLIEILEAVSIFYWWEPISVHNK
jgi:hypothetical protein